ncbi:MAG: M28 family peptidase [Prevotella sp.]|nr:M28 family peptidase [Prevotella sp.]
MKKKYVTRIIIAIVALLFGYAYAIHPLVMNRKAAKHAEAVDNTDRRKPVGPAFDADSALFFCAEQCAFGPRTMNSVAHDQCGEWIVGRFKQYGLTVDQQKTDLKGYDGTTLKATNIIARYQPEKADRIVVCAHWDSRPWADNDPNEDNWHQPVMAANDGASGVAVMIELARLLASAEPLPIGIDFVCFDAEDWGTPQWAEEGQESSETWALGARYWSENLPEGYHPRYGILLDMVGGQGAKFYYEAYSKYYAADVMKHIWRAAHDTGMGSFFPKRDGGGVTDDHVPINQKAHIPTVDIIAYYPDCAESSFGPTWHTVNDDMNHLDSHTLKAVGQTLVQVIFSEK